MKYPFVQVLTLSYNGKKLLEECLPSLLTLQYPNYHVAVIDNGSTDGTKEWLEQEYPSVKILRSERNVGYPGFNIGFEYAFFEQKSDYVLYVNNDTIIDPQALINLVTVAKMKEKAGFITGKVYFQSQPDILQTTGINFHPILWIGRSIGEGEKDMGQYDQVCERAFLDDIFMLVLRQLYVDIGGFSTNFFCHSEEMDWQARAKKRGWRFYYTPEAKIWHKHSATIGIGSPRTIYYAVRNRILVIARNRNIAVLIGFLILYPFFLLRNCIGELRQKHVKQSLAYIIGYFKGILWLFHRRTGNDLPSYLK